jgi:hypothetical protein
MPKFIGELDMRDNDGFPFTLLAPLGFESDVLKRTITVPAGFKTDLASIPAPVWILIPKVGKYDKAAVIHDFLYANNGCTRDEADNVLKEAMRVLNVPGWRLHLIYAGVRAGGWDSWNDYRSRDVKNA